MKGEADVMLDHAEQFLGSARDNLLRDPPRLHVALDEARTSAELAGKALLLKKQGSYPRKHEIGGDLYQASLLPEDLDPRETARLLQQHTRGSYGFADAVSVDEIRDAVGIAAVLVEAGRAWPSGTFHQPPPDP